MHAAVHIGVVAAVELHRGLDHRPRLLAGRGAVQVDQRLAVDHLVQSRKVGSHSLDIEPALLDPKILSGANHRSPSSTRFAGSFELTSFWIWPRIDGTSTRPTISLAKA